MQGEGGKMQGKEEKNKKRKNASVALHICAFLGNYPGSRTPDTARRVHRGQNEDCLNALGVT